MESTEERKLHGLLLALLAERDRRLQVSVNDGQLEISLDGFWMSFAVNSHCELSLIHSDQDIPYLATDKFLHLVPEKYRQSLQRPNNVHSVSIKMNQFYLGFSTETPSWTMWYSAAYGVCMKLDLDKDKVAKLVQAFDVLRMTQVFPDEDKITVVWENKFNQTE